MTNRQQLEKRLEVPIGCYHPEMELLNPANLKKVFSALSYGGDTDVEVCINRKKHVVEIFREGLDEIDFLVISKKEYHERYGA